MSRTIMQISVQLVWDWPVSNRTIHIFRAVLKKFSVYLTWNTIYEVNKIKYISVYMDSRTAVARSFHLHSDFK
jgi:hypothetical protein